MSNFNISIQLQEQVQEAIQSKNSLRLCGGNSKSFYGRKVVGKKLELKEHRGVVHYEPSELVVTARAGTTLAELEQTLDQQQQILPFEPPGFNGQATLGGTIACNMSGPGRPYRGAARDYVLGCKIINGQGEILKFGGEVLKNVAGYDVSRLMTGAFGTLGVLLEVSLKVLPKPAAEMTLKVEATAQQSLQKLHQWLQYPYPISATCFDGKTLWIRLSATRNALEKSYSRLGGERLNLEEANQLWQDVKEQQLDYFKSKDPLWRISVPSNVEPLALQGQWLYEWNGALRWLKSTESVPRIREQVAKMGGQATLYRGDISDQVFHPLHSNLFTLHQKIKKAFDPYGIFNSGRLYSQL